MSVSAAIETEDLVYTLQGMGIETGVDLEKLWQAGQVAEAIGRNFSSGRTGEARGGSSYSSSGRYRIASKEPPC